ncbi:XTP/dITP diphosphatase [Alkalibacter saccharofermentans]|uniref:dITP/XTP pyrophosphatase n=1 Tax=Alkalibacter saccharofermentans DSM 14828 TaxID=1120975 RepID=A0A1M4ZLB7_9FIRM|nr:XTP/dITP diphosphohydrolase [Alkalibacter saccharofermentans DSM 14828]
MKIVLATGNAHKKIEIEDILKNRNIEISTMKDEGIFVDIVEDGITFEENALIKARAVKANTENAVMADDSGLEVEYLNNAPGVRSARFAGEDATDAENNEKLLKLLKNIPKEDRRARFVCVVALIDEGGREYIFRGECEGIIANELAGEGGFGYDPLFFVESAGKTYAQLTSEEKNKISHRAMALKEAGELMNRLSGGQR